MRKLLAAGAAVFLFSCSNAEPLKTGEVLNSPQFQVEIKKDLGVKKVHVYEGEIKDTLRGVMIKTPVLVVKGKNGQNEIYLFPQREVKNEKVGEVILPAYQVRPLVLKKDDRIVKGVKKALSLYEKAGLNLKVTDGKKGTVYLVGDALCPYCAMKMEPVKNYLEKKGYTAYYVPYPVHGENSIKAFACLAGDKKNFIKNLEKFYKEALKEKKPLYVLFKEKFKRCRPDKNLEELFKKGGDALLKSGINGTPFILTEKGDEYTTKLP